MEIWNILTETQHTQFDFLFKEDKAQLANLVENYIDLSLPVGDKWQSPFMLSSEPMKHPDFFEIEGTGVIAASQKAVDALKEYLSNKVELLPIETDLGKCYAINVVNFVDCLNKKKSVFTATKTGAIASYTLLEFDEEKIGNNAIFKIPELPYLTFITDDIQSVCEEEYLKGLEFDEKLNLVWYPE